MSIKRNSMTQRKFWTNFISYIQANCAKYQNNYQQKQAKKLHSCKHEFLKKRVMLRAYQNVTSVSRLNKIEQDWSFN